MYLKVRVWVIGVLVFGSMLLTCGLNEIDDPLSVSGISSSHTYSLYNSNMVMTDTFLNYETVYLDIRDLIPNEQTEIRVIRKSNDVTLERLLVNSDKNGMIKGLPIWENIGVDNDNRLRNAAGDYIINVLQPPKNDPWTEWIIPFTVTDNMNMRPNLFPCNPDGSFHGMNYVQYEPVWAKIGGMTPGTYVRFYVVPSREMYAAGDSYDDAIGEYKTGVVSNDGSIVPVLFWYSATMQGVYDLVVDTPPHNAYNEDDLVSGMLKPGFAVQQPSNQSDLIVDISANEMGMYTDCFDPLDPVYGKALPLRRPHMYKQWTMEYPNYVPVYIMHHRDVWNPGDKLVAIPSTGSHEGPVYLQVDPYSGFMGLSILRAGAKPLFLNPLKLWPGCYDIIVDIDQDGMYTPGTDLLDGGPRYGFAIEPCDCSGPGECVFYSTTSGDLQSRDLDEMVDICGVAMDADGNPVAGVQVSFSIVQGPGVLLGTKATTDASGQACVQFQGAEYGKMSKIRVEATVCDSLHYDVATIFRAVPHTHNQGVVIGD